MSDKERIFDLDEIERIAIIDYGMGNLFSVQQACRQVGLIPMVTNNGKELLEADGAILPGVGAFGDAMDSLRRLDLVRTIEDFISSGKIFMGICLGMQLLMSESEEFGKHQGLGIFEGKTVKFPPRKNDGNKIKIPQVGWNKILLPAARNRSFWDGTALHGFSSDEYLYFVHSYYVQPDFKDITLSVSYYEDVEYCSSLLQKNIFACQFHPEKSGPKGLEIYNNFKKLILNQKSKKYNKGNDII